MLKSKTLLIVGAGASKEAALPIGIELMPAILKSVKIEFQAHWSPKMEDELRRALKVQETTRNRDLNNEIHHYANAYRAMAEGLKLSISIDNYLDAHRDDHYIQVLGKIGIVMAILQAESRSHLSINDKNECDVSRVSQTWYAELFKIMNEGVPSTSLDRFFSKLEIISFNYDRCIEHFFERALRSYYGVDADKAAGVASKLRIYHPYGRVGALPWQMPNQSTQFGSMEAHAAEIIRLAAQIKTFTERQDDDELVRRMKQAVESAETIVFLGFAFHPQNLELIAPNQAARAKRVFASAYGMSKSDIDTTREEIAGWLQRPDERIHVEIASLTCSQLFGEYRRSIPRP